MNTALKEHQAGNLDLAEKLYRGILDITPQNYDVLHLLSILLAQKHDFLNARHFMQLALEINPESSIFHNCMASILKSLSKYDEAIFHYKKALQLNPNINNVLADYNLGIILSNKERYEEAIYHFKNVLKLQPNNIEVLHNLGSIYLLQKNLTEALPYFLQLVKLVQDFDVYYNIGVIYMDLSRLNDAIIYFNEAMKIRPNDFSVCTNLATVYLRLQNFIEAEKYYNQAHLLQPDNKEISYLLAAIKQKDNIQKAPAEYVKHLFDQYAPYFEQHLKLLDYKVPQLLFSSVQTVVGDSLKILDLGCGTGMCGSEFKSISRELIGIDLSEKMLGLAKQKSVYTDLKNISIEEAITTFSDIDLIIAAESLVYFGELEKIFIDCHKTLKAGGIFVFTVENTDQYPYTLQQTARFAHHVDYITKIATHNGFIILKSNKIMLRKHYDSIINGHIFVLKRHSVPQLIKSNR